MQTHTTKTLRHMTDDQLAASPQSRSRAITYWIVTFLLVFELVAGSLWNLLQIEFVRVQNQLHLGYPSYFSYILGVWQMGGAAVIIAPRFPRLKEWAYAGSFFLFSGAIASHMSAGDSVVTWLMPVVFLMFVIVSWALRPADRRLPNARFAPETLPLAWAVPIGILLLLIVVSYVTLPKGPPPYYADHPAS